MQDTDLLLSLAEIAGVFVGFGALIAVRSGGATEVAEVAYMRAVVSMGMLTVVAAIAPVVLDRYGFSGHQLWAISAVLALVGWFVLVVAMARTPEYRANMAAEFRADRGPWWLVAVQAVAWLLFVAASLLAPTVIALGLQPQLDRALYVTVVLLILFGAAWSLLSLVYSQRRPTNA